MNYTFNFWLGVAAIFTIGTLAHFIYGWSRQNKIIGLFAAVNESTWEHIKIALTASLLWCLYDGFIYGMEPNYFLAKTTSLLVLTLSIPLIFYTYRAIFKKDVLIIDIADFLISIILSQITFFVIITCPDQSHFVNYLACIGLFVFFGSYMTLTLEPIKNFLFKDPITGKYGFYVHRNLKRKIKNHKKTAKKS